MRKTGDLVLIHRAGRWRVALVVDQRQESDHRMMSVYVDGEVVCVPDFYLIDIEES